MSDNNNNKSAASTPDDPYDFSPERLHRLISEEAARARDAVDMRKRMDDYWDARARNEAPGQIGAQRDPLDFYSEAATQWARDEGLRRRWITAERAKAELTADARHAAREVGQPCPHERRNTECVLTYQGVDCRCYPRLARDGGRERTREP